MLELEVPVTEFYDEENNEFFTIEVGKIEMEHSLVSLSKWESKWHEPFIQYNDEPRSKEKTLDYIRCMTLTEDVDPRFYQCLPSATMKEINEYINDPMTATWFRDTPRRGNREVVTAELIYYWMIALNIPFECQYWHLNRLLTLIRVCSEKNQPKKKMNRSDQAQQQSSLNAQRKAKYGTSG